MEQPTFDLGDAQEEFEKLQEELDNIHMRNTMNSMKNELFKVFNQFDRRLKKIEQKLQIEKNQR